MIRGDTAILPAEQVHYLRDVLRLKNGDIAEVFDGEGKNYSGILLFRGEEAYLSSLVPVECAQEPASALILAQALIRSDRFELVLQKATELGVHQILPLETRYCEVRINESRIEARQKRWQSIVRNASRQCGRALVPEIRCPVAFSDFLHSSEWEGTVRLMFHGRSAQAWDPAEVPAGAALACIGPEGGWHPDEAAAAAEAGFRVFSLGPRVLRAETAAIVTLALLQFRVADSRREVENAAG
jgi:16S rRNA (uracil1498-N3)-methyltransferase